jgi:hypothetical protein
MRLMKGLLVGLVLAGILALAPTAAFAHDGGGGGHGGGFGGRGHSTGWGHGDWQEGQETVDWQRYNGRRLFGFIWY